MALHSQRVTVFLAVLGIDAVIMCRLTFLKLSSPTLVFRVQLFCDTQSSEYCESIDDATTLSAFCSDAAVGVCNLVPVHVSMKCYIRKSALEHLCPPLLSTAAWKITTHSGSCISWIILYTAVVLWFHLCPRDIYVAISSKILSSLRRSSAFK